MHATLIAFAMVMFVAIATPGPIVLLALSNGSRFGVRRAIYGMAGAVLADFILIGSVGFGLGAILSASVLLFEIVKWLGVGYLTIVGLMLLRSTGAFADPFDAATNRSAPGWRLFLKSFSVTATNPKSYLFYTAFLPQFVIPAEPQFSQYLTLALICAGMNLIIMMVYASLGAWAVHWLKTRGALWIDRVCGGVLLALAASLAFYRRQAA